MNSKRLIDTFCEFVKIPSESPNDKEFVSYMEKLLQKEGAKTVKDNFGNLIAKFPAKNSNSKIPVAFTCHGDTVKPGIGIEPVIEKGIIRSKGDTILGADDKAGIAEVLEAIRSAEKYPPFEFIITRCEESATEGSSKLDYSLIDSKMAFCFDEENITDVIRGAPTKFALYVEYTGISAHASEPENGVSAVIPAAKAISRLRLGKLDDHTTANVGIIEGGEVINGIPGKAKVVAECRSTDHNKAVALCKEMEGIFKKAAEECNVKVDVRPELKYYSFLLKEDSPVIKLAVDALSKHGIKPNVRVITGGLDSNNFNRNGIQTATVGVGSGEIHTKKEFAIIKDMETMVKVAIDILENLA
ncbi:MAG: M20/M25/M40 family metallo-hydrolase [Pseudomonadota bacterium]